MAAICPLAASCVTAMTPALLASSAHLQSDGINKADQYRQQTLLDTERWKKRHTWTWGGALNTNVTALAMSSAFKHWEGETEVLFSLCETRLWLSVQSARLLSYSHTLQLPSPDHCYGAWRQTQSPLFQEKYTADKLKSSTHWNTNRSGCLLCDGGAEHLTVALMRVFASRSSCRKPSVRAVTAYLVAQ